MTIKHKFYLFELTGDGPNRLQGTKGYSNRRNVEIAAEAFLREFPHRRVTVFEALQTMWVDPNPLIISDFGIPEPGVPEEA